jgi:hypothetical protein
VHDSRRCRLEEERKLFATRIAELEAKSDSPLAPTAPTPHGIETAAQKEHGDTADASHPAAPLSLDKAGATSIPVAHRSGDTHTATLTATHNALAPKPAAKELGHAAPHGMSEVHSAVGNAGDRAPHHPPPASPPAPPHSLDQPPAFPSRTRQQEPFAAIDRTHHRQPQTTRQEEPQPPLTQHRDSRDSPPNDPAGHPTRTPLSACSQAEVSVQQEWPAGHVLASAHSQSAQSIVTPDPVDDCWRRLPLLVAQLLPSKPVPTAASNHIDTPQHRTFVSSDTRDIEQAPCHMATDKSSHQAISQQLPVIPNTTNSNATDLTLLHMPEVLDQGSPVSRAARLLVSSLQLSAQCDSLSPHVPWPPNGKDPLVHSVDGAHWAGSEPSAIVDSTCSATLPGFVASGAQSGVAALSSRFTVLALPEGENQQHALQFPLLPPPHVLQTRHPAHAQLHQDGLAGLRASFHGEPLSKTLALSHASQSTSPLQIEDLSPPAAPHVYTMLDPAAHGRAYGQHPSLIRPEVQRSTRVGQAHPHPGTLSQHHQTRALADPLVSQSERSAARLQRALLGCAQASGDPCTQRHFLRADSSPSLFAPPTTEHGPQGPDAHTVRADEESRCSHMSGTGDTFHYDRSPQDASLVHDLLHHQRTSPAAWALDHHQRTSPARALDSEEWVELPAVPLQSEHVARSRQPEAPDTVWTARARDIGMHVAEQSSRTRNSDSMLVDPYSRAPAQARSHRVPQEAVEQSLSSFHRASTLGHAQGRHTGRPDPTRALLDEAIMVSHTLARMHQGMDDGSVEEPLTLDEIMGSTSLARTRQARVATKSQRQAWRPDGRREGRRGR